MCECCWCFASHRTNVSTYLCARHTLQKNMRNIPATHKSHAGDPFCLVWYNGHLIHADIPVSRVNRLCPHSTQTLKDDEASAWMRMDWKFTLQTSHELSCRWFHPKPSCLQFLAPSSSNSTTQSVVYVDCPCLHINSEHTSANLLSVFPGGMSTQGWQVLFFNTCSYGHSRHSFPGSKLVFPAAHEKQLCVEAYKASQPTFV